MKTIKGPALFLGQFAGDAAPFNSWDAITRWAADKGYLGVQVPTWASQLIDLKKARDAEAGPTGDSAADTIKRARKAPVAKKG